MSAIFTAFLGGAQGGIVETPLAILWNRDATKVLRVRRVIRFMGSPQYREWISGLLCLCDLMVYGVGFDALGYYDRGALAHDQAAEPLGEVVCASGQGYGASASSVQIVGAGATVRRAYGSCNAPSFTTTYAYTLTALHAYPYYGELYRAPEDATVQPITLRRGEALVLWDLGKQATYRIPNNVVFEFEQADA